MPKLTLSDIAGGYNAPTKINANNALIEAALENTLSRDGTSPNQMEADFDMNGYRIVNVASPQGPLDVARLVDITGLLTLTGAEVPSMSGNANKVLFTDGSAMYWGNVPATALPEFTTTVQGVVPPPTAGADERTLWADGTWATPAAKDNYARTDDANTWSVAQRYAFNTVTYATSLTIDTSLANTYKVTLTGNPTITLSNAASGRKLRIYLIQDGTGGRSVTWPTITWAADSSPVLSTEADAVNYVDLEYDGSTWFGSWDQVGDGGVGIDPSDYDIVFSVSEKNVDLFRRLGAPVSVDTWEIAIAPGVVIHTDSILEEALDLSGAFPSGTVINILNQGHIIGKGGRGADAIGGQKHGDAVYSFGTNKAQAGGNAIKGPATGVTVNIDNSSGYIWGGGGGGGAGASNTDDNGIGIGGAGGGGAGMGEGGRGASMRMRGNSITATSNDAGNGRLNLDGTAAGGSGAAGAGNGDAGASDYSVGAGGDGGDYGSAGSAGGAGTPFTGSSALDVAATTGGAAGRAVTASYAGTLNITAGSSSPNVKGSV